MTIKNKSGHDSLACMNAKSQQQNNWMSAGVQKILSV